MGNLTMTSEIRKCYHAREFAGVPFVTIPLLPRDKFNSFTPPCKEIFMFDAVPKQLGYVKELSIEIVCSSLPSQQYFVIQIISSCCLVNNLKTEL